MRTRVRYESTEYLQHKPSIKGLIGQFYAARIDLADSLITADEFKRPPDTGNVADHADQMDRIYAELERRGDVAMFLFRYVGNWPPGMSTLKGI